MPKEFFEERNIPCVYYHYEMDGVEYPDDFGQTMPFDEFYARISAGSQPTTSLVTVVEYVDFFRPILAEGNDILHIAFSSGLSGSYNSACLARDELLEEFPNAKFEVVDSLAASSGYGLLVSYVADLRDKGATLEEARDWAEANKLKVHHWFFSTDLTSYKRGGRVNAPEAAIATILNICPMLNVDYEGHLIPREKIRTKKKAIQSIVDHMVQYADDGLNYSGKCFICHSACQEDAEAIRDLVASKFKSLDGEIIINSIGTVIGSHSGPGTAALFFMGAKRVD
jgi:DegV family protein with EDD domain